MTAGGLAARAEEYLAIRRRLGYELVTPGRLVRRFAADCDAAAITTVTAQVAVEWARRSSSAQDWTRWLRLSAIRGFAAYLHAIDPGHQIPARELLPRRQVRPVPSVLSAGDVEALLAQASLLRPALQAATYRTLIGVLAATGCRPGEIVRLEEDDIDWDTAFITVHGKNHLERRLPLHPSTVAALASYRRLRDQALGPQAGPSLLVTLAGHRLSLSHAGHVFAGLVTAVGLQEGTGSRRPTLMSLRHTFAVTTLTGWLNDDGDVQARLPVLSTWMGHRQPQSTYYYLQAVPELLSAVSDRTQRAQAGAPVAVPVPGRRANSPREMP
jgi:integrase/recombinase XerD